MEVEFARTGERRYRVLVLRERAPDLVMDPAPGFDEQLPHDLVHFLVEREWRLEHGIFGQLAAGGDAGTFWPIQLAELRRQRARGVRVRAAREPETGRSERLAHLVGAAWRARRGLEVDEQQAQAVGEELDTAVLDRALEQLDELAKRWSALQVGGSLRLPWPWPEGPRHQAHRRARRREAARPSRARARPA